MSAQQPVAAAGPGNAAPGAATGQQDALDKGVSQLLGKTGHGQSNATVEKITDGIRKIYKKITGKDVPIADKQ